MCTERGDRGEGGRERERDRERDLPGIDLVHDYEMCTARGERGEREG